MSYSLREYLKSIEKKLRDDMKLTQEQWDLVKDNLRDYCSYGDKILKEFLHREDIDVDAEFDNLSEDDKLAICEAVIRKILEDCDTKKKSKKKKQKSSESDSDADGNSTEDEEAEEEELEVACGEGD